MSSTELTPVRGKTQRAASPLSSVLESYRKPLAELLSQRLEKDDGNKLLPPPMRRALVESTSHNGKLIRPALVLLACQAAGGSASAAMPAAVSVELMHDAVLVYDDIIDKDRVRRGAPAAHVKYGQDVALVLAGILLSNALNLVSNSRRIIPVVCKVLNDLGVGEAIELCSDVVGQEDYLRMVMKKTASLFEASALIGARLAGANPELEAEFSAYGMNLGIAFQIRDDILGSVGEEATLGKPVGSDLLNGRPNIVSVCLATNLGVGLADLQRRIEVHGAGHLRASPEFQRALKKAERLSQLYKARSKLAILPVPDSRHKENLYQLANFVVDRAS
jgi:geranylgeranyl diphosphate synthase, type I